VTPYLTAVKILKKSIEWKIFAQNKQFTCSKPGVKNETLMTFQILSVKYQSALLKKTMFLITALSVKHGEKRSLN